MDWHLKQFNERCHFKLSQTRANKFCAMKLFNHLIFIFFAQNQLTRRNHRSVWRSLNSFTYFFLNKNNSIFFATKVRTFVQHKEPWKDFNVMTSKVCEMLKVREKNNKNVLFNQFVFNWLSFIVKKQNCWSKL